MSATPSFAMNAAAMGLFRDRLLKAGSVTRRIGELIAAPSMA
jgi:hypothetical protein